MRIQDVDMAALLPSWMRDNEDDIAFTKSVNDTAKKVYATAQLLSLWDKLDEVPEGVLDELAWTLDVDWYDYGASVETKRQLIRTSDYIHAKKGTVAAVESVIKAYLGESRLMEWFEYAGEPHHFKAFTTEPAYVEQNLDKFLDMLARVKRHSSKLDSIMIGLTGECQIYIGTVSRDFAHETHAMPHEQILRLIGVGFIQRDNERVYMGVIRGLEGDLILTYTKGVGTIDRESIQVRMTSDNPIYADLVALTQIGVATYQHETVTVRLGIGG